MPCSGRLENGTTHAARGLDPATKVGPASSIAVQKGHEDRPDTPAWIRWYVWAEGFRSCGKSGRPGVSRKKSGFKRERG
jgi:hypothetical protein